MNNRKNQNSILVLATLGVYFGLILVGATPQVLAQAATAKLFDVKDEIEVKEDLDKKPKGGSDDTFVGSINVYLQDLDVYLQNVRKADEYLHSIYDPAEARAVGHYFGVYRRDPEQVLIAPCRRSGDSNQTLDQKDATYFTTLPILLNPEYRDSNWSWTPMGCKRLDGSKPAKDEFAEIEVSGTQKGLFTYRTAINLSSPELALNCFREFENAFNNVQANDLTSRQNVLWKNTKLTIVDNSVFITTRLPRGSLDTLLASDAK